VTERETLLAEIAERQARLAELDALDPLLIEAREIAARCSLFPARIARDYLGGEMDKGPLVTSALAALRRGMELAEAPPMGSSCPSCDGLNLSCPEGCGRDENGELDGSTLTPPMGSVMGEALEALRYCAEAPLSGWTIAQSVALAAIAKIEGEQP